MGCEAHTYHWPRALTFEDHHVVPQAWQKLAKGKVYDRRVVRLCPTGHRNVHHYIVRLMKGESVSVRSREARIATEALTRWVESGRTLDELRAAGLYGEA